MGKDDTMTDAIAIITPRTLSEAQDLAKALAPAATLPPALRGKPAEVLLAIMTGAELGLAQMASIRGIHVIEGKPCLAADLMAGVVMGSPLCEFLRCAETTGTRAVYVAKRRGQPEISLAFTMAQAQSAGLSGKGNWAKYPDAMLRARACAAICRMVWPDLLSGVYDPDELTPAPSMARASDIIGEVVSTVPATPPPAPKPETPWDVALEICKAHGVEWTKMREWMRDTRKRTTPKSVTAEDVESYRLLLSAEPAPESLPYDLPGAP
jgi:hypothetical protein